MKNERMQAHRAQMAALEAEVERILGDDEEFADAFAAWLLTGEYKSLHQEQAAAALRAVRLDCACDGPSRKAWEVADRIATTKAMASPVVMAPPEPSP